MKGYFSNIMALILLVGIITPTFLLSFLQIKKLTTRFNMKHKLEASLLHKVKIDNHQVHWVKKGKELIINNRLFDVEKWHYTNNSIIVYGLYDDDETLLSLQLNDLLKKRFPDYNKTTNQLFHFLQNLYFQNLALKSINEISNTKSYVIVGLIKFKNEFYDIELPPPRTLAII